MLFNELETNRLSLKNISLNDREFIYKQFSDDITNRYLFDEEPLTDIQGADVFYGQSRNYIFRGNNYEHQIFTLNF
ncbi:MAG: hypothetical protein FWD71_16150 [Oscillospiraceae bacterium]|nr:hypothetical protein [Oscillospiraceae bacterium]